MKDLLEHIVKSIVDKPEEVIISEVKDPVAGTILTISVNETDMGKVIGKEGKIINAIRTVVRILAIKNGDRVTVNIEDKNPPTASKTDLPSPTE